MLIHLQRVIQPIDWIIYGYRDDQPDGYAQRLPYSLVGGLSLMPAGEARIGPLLRADGRVDLGVMAAIGLAIRREGLPVDVVTAERNRHEQRYVVADVIARAARKESP